MMTRRRSVTIALATTAMTVSALVGSTTAAPAAPSPTDVVRTYAADPSTLGDVPDATDDDGDICTSTLPGVREVSVPVTGVTTPITDVRVSLTLDHTYLSDLSFVLVAPNGTQVAFLDRIGDGGATPCNYSNNLAGTYTFFDGAVGNIAGFAAGSMDDGDVPAGPYYPARSTGASVPLSAPFANLGAAANGTWKIRVIDYDTGDTGTISAATLTLATQARSETVACKSATAAATAAQAAVVSSTKALAKAKKKLKKAKKSDLGKQAKVKKVKQAKKKVKKAKKALAAGQAASTAATSARTASC